MMRMVIEINEGLHGRLKTRARDEGRPLAHIVRELIEDYLDEQGDQRRSRHPRQADQEAVPASRS